MTIWPAERKAEVRRLYEMGCSASSISMHMFGNQDYKDAILGQIHRMKLRRTAPLIRMLTHQRVVPWTRVSSRERAMRLGEVPADLRTLTARIFGDPLPGRSALDRERR